MEHHCQVGWCPLRDSNREPPKYESNLNGRHYTGDLGTDGMIVMRAYLKDKGWEVVEWIHLAQNREQALVNMVMNLWIPQT
jgi:hypothetical protein